MNQFQRTMQPYPGLENYADKINLPQNKLSLYCYQAGDQAAPPLLLIHGLGDDADTWRHLIPALAANHRVIAIDLPGFGRSDKPNIAYTIPFFLDVIAELLDVLSTKRVTLVGHSLGAILAHTFAVEHPACVKRLVLIGGALAAQSQKLNPVTLMFLVPVLGEWLYNRLRNDPPAAYRSLEPYYYRLAQLPEADRQFLFQRVNERVWSNDQRRAFLSTLRNLARWIPARQHALALRLASVNVPTLALWGEQDQINNVENGKVLITLQPSARLVVVPNAGHNVQQENPNAVHTAIQT